jgi:hypothetical protein
MSFYEVNVDEAMDVVRTSGNCAIALPTVQFYDGPSVVQVIVAGSWSEFRRELVSFSKKVDEASEGQVMARSAASSN